MSFKFPSPSSNLFQLFRPASPAPGAMIIQEGPPSRGARPASPSGGGGGHHATLATSASLVQQGLPPSSAVAQILPNSGSPTSVASVQNVSVTCSDCRLWSSLEVPVPLTLSWQEIYVFVKKRRCKPRKDEPAVCRHGDGDCCRKSSRQRQNDEKDTNAHHQDHHCSHHHLDHGPYQKATLKRGYVDQERTISSESLREQPSVFGNSVVMADEVLEVNKIMVGIGWLEDSSVRSPTISGSRGSHCTYTDTGLFKGLMEDASIKTSTISETRGIYSSYTEIELERTVSSLVDDLRDVKPMKWETNISDRPLDPPESTADEETISSVDKPSSDPSGFEEAARQIGWSGASDFDLPCERECTPVTPERERASVPAYREQSAIPVVSSLAERPVTPEERARIPLVSSRVDRSASTDVTGNNVTRSDVSSSSHDVVTSSVKPASAPRRLPVYKGSPDKSCLRTSISASTAARGATPAGKLPKRVRVIPTPRGGGAHSSSGGGGEAALTRCQSQGERERRSPGRKDRESWREERGKPGERTEERRSAARERCLVTRGSSSLRKPHSGFAAERKLPTYADLRRPARDKVGGDAAASERKHSVDGAQFGKLPHPAETVGVRAQRPTSCATRVESVYGNLRYGPGRGGKRGENRSTVCVHRPPVPTGTLGIRGGPRKLERPCDRENPPWDKESPPCDKASPLRNKESPPCGEENPLWWDIENSPWDNENPPWDNESPPWDNENSPCGNENSPCDNANSPWDNENSPWDDENPLHDKTGETEAGLWLRAEDAMDLNENRPAARSSSQVDAQTASVMMVNLVPGQVLDETVDQTPKRRKKRRAREDAKHHEPPYYWKPLLRRVTGLLKPGSMLLIMGVSGAGKTTLLNVLGGRCPKACRVTGKVKINGIEVKAETLKQFTAYVPYKRTTFLSELTVEETLTFRASLVLHDCRQRRRANRVAAALIDSDLMQQSSYYVGKNGSGDPRLSEAELHRLALACELITNPPFVLCDEPFADLNPEAERAMLRVLSRLAARGHTIICTAGKPSTAALTFINKVVLLADGHLTFMGTMQEGYAFFKSSEGNFCPYNVSPVDYLMQAINFAGSPGYVKFQNEHLSQRFRNTVQAQETKILITDLTMANAFRSSRGLEDNPTQRLIASYNARLPASFRAQYKANLWRCWTTVSRRKCWVLCRVISLVLLCVTIGCMVEVDLERKPNTRSVLDGSAAIFILIVVTCCSYFYHTVCLLPEWLPLLQEDCGRDSLFRLDAFYLALTVTQLPFDLFHPAISTSVLYFMMGLRRDAGPFCVALSILVLTANVSGSFGLMWSLLHGGEGSATGMVFLPLLVASGHLVSLASIPGWLSWTSALSWFRHASELLMVSQWDVGSSVHCPPAGSPNSTDLARLLLQGPAWPLVILPDLSGSRAAGNITDASRAMPSATENATEWNSTVPEEVLSEAFGDLLLLQSEEVEVRVDRSPDEWKGNSSSSDDTPGPEQAWSTLRTCLFRDVLDSYGYSAQSWWMNWAALVALLLFFRLGAYFFLRRLTRTSA